MDWSDSVAGAVEGGFGIIGSLVNYGLQKRLAAQQNQYNIDMWKMQNEYNSPSAQMRRYQEAGLNPALMYGQVTPGNATSAPVQHVPDAPDMRELRELGKAFNIEGLKQAIADTKLKRATARQAEAAADRAEGENEALHQLRWQYHFDPSSGQYVYDGGISSQEGDNYNSKVVYPRVRSLADGYLMKILSDNFRTNSLLVPRGRLIGSQALLNDKRGIYTDQQYDYLLERQKLLAPQLRMLNYQSKYFPATFWIGNAAKGAQAVSAFLPF